MLYTFLHASVGLTDCISYVRMLTIIILLEPLLLGPMFPVIYKTFFFFVFREGHSVLCRTDIM